VSYLGGEILLRLAKAAVALVAGLVIYAIVLTVSHEPPSATLFLLSWLSGAAFVLLVQESPI
jgi:hypothetical protein